MQGQLTSAMMCDPPERLQFGFQKAEVPAITNTVDRQCSLVHPETHFVNPLLASHADGVKSYRRRCQSQRGRPTPDALCSRGSLCGLDMSVLGHLPSSGGVWIRPSAFWAIFPEVPPCGGKEPRMTCQFGQDCHCTSVWLTVLRKLIPPNPNL